MLKMESMTERWFGGAKPEIRPLSEMDPNYNRAHEYVRRLPFVRCGDYAPGIVYLAGAMLAHDIIVAGDSYDLAIMASQHVEAGNRIEDWYPELEVNWNYEVLETAEDKQYGDRFLHERGPFVLLTFFNGGYYPETKAQMSDERKVEIVRKLKEALPGCEMILTGGWWDRDYHNLLVQMGMPASISSGETSVGELFALMRRATAWVGHQAGNTMMAQHLRCPTVLYWSTMWRSSPRVRHLEDGMWTCWVQRERIARTYDAIEMSEPDEITVRSVLRSIKEKRDALCGADAVSASGCVGAPSEG
jgi:hypothetical protein